ncbi:MAG: D-2-hydroxyacid dehydrogenase [Woeseiaceae bacterium]|nr:D-2-hydroxyacid dehydrogenase [Woeseiaceae bacterium]
MNQAVLLFVAGVFFLLHATTSPAEISIEELIGDAGIVEGPIAMRDLPQWQGARRLLVSRLDDEVDELRALMPDVEFVVVNAEVDAIEKVGHVDAIIGLCSERLLAAAKSAVWVQIFSSGAGHCVNVPAVASGQIVLTNMQKMSAPVIGEHAVAMMLALARRLPVYAKGMSQGAWMRRSEASTAMFPVSGKTMLVIGLGGIGTEVAERAAALGMRVVATRNSSRDGPSFVEYVGLSDELLDLVGQAEVIVNALPLTDSTRNLLDAEFFAATRKGALFINVGRGGTVDTDALTDAIRNGQIGGAGLDVTDPEPLPSDHALWQLDNVIITPHVASRGGERERHFVLLKENLRRFAAGERLLNVVDPERGY